MDTDEVLEAFRNCISDRKCENKDCPYESRCDICNSKSQYLNIPKHLALDVERMLVSLMNTDVEPIKTCSVYVVKKNGRYLKTYRNGVAYWNDTPKEAADWPISDMDLALDTAKYFAEIVHGRVVKVTYYEEDVND